MMKMTAEDWYTVLAVNLSGAFFCSQAAMGHMLERGGGRIVNISSLRADRQHRPVELRGIEVGDVRSY